MYGDCPIFDNFGRDFQQLLWLSEQTEEPAIQNTCSLCTDTQLQFTATNVKSKGLTVPRKCPIIHGDWKSMHYSTNFVRVCGGCTLIHAPAPGSTLKHELQKHLVKVELLGEPLGGHSWKLTYLDLLHALLLVLFS